MFQQQSFAQCATTDVESRTPVIGTHVTGARTVTTTNQTINPANKNSWYTFPVVTGVEYFFGNCSTTFDPCLEGRNGSATGTVVINWDDNAEATCATGARELIYWTSGFTGTLYAGTHHYNNTWPDATSAILDYRQSSTVSNTTSNATMCPGDTKALTSTVTSVQCAEASAVTWSVFSGGGSIAGTTYTAGAAGSVTVRATHGVSTSDVTFTVSPAAPSGLTYGTDPATYCANVAISTNSPSLSGGGAPTSYSVSPALPAGLSLNTTTGAITGTPTTTAGVATATYTVTATNSCGSTTKGVSITISPAAPSGLTYGTDPATYCANVAISTNSPSLSGGGAPTSYSVSPALPAGLSLNTTTGAITGTPTTTAGVATATYTVTATNSCGSTTKGVSITISPAKPSGLTYGTDPATYCANVAISTNSPSLSGGGAPTSYSVSPALPAGLSLNTTTGAITGTPTTTAGVATATYTVTATNSCGSTTKGVSITISPAKPSGLTYGTDPATYCANVAISTNSPSLSGGGAPTSYSVSPALPAGLSLNTTTGAITGTPTTTAGVATATYTVSATNSCGSATKGVSITISPAAPSGLTYGTDPATYCANVAISTNSPSLSGGGAPTSYSVSPALPAGLSLNTTTGAITGTPTTTAGVATATYTVTATNSCGSTTKGVSITISPAAPSGLTYGTDPATYCANVAISTNSPSLSGGGAPTSYSVSPALPAGLSLNTTTGAITGTPTTTAGVATATYTVTATNSCGSTTKGVSITISPAAPSGLTYGTDPATYCANVAISTNSPSLSGGGAPTSYSVSPALPAGLSLNTTTGAITGTPTTTAGVATATYTVTATNSCGSTTKGVSITISPAAPSGLTYGTDPATYCANVAISTNSPSLSGGGAPTSYSVSPALPAGLSLNTTTGAITGTPTTTAGVATATYTVTATNSCGSTTKGVSITISPAAPSGLTYGTDPATYCANVAISTNSPSLSGGGAPTSYSVSPALPAGLSLNTTTGAITGTPTTTAGVATATYTVSATNSCGSATKGVSITISPAAPSGLTYGTDPATYCANVAISTNSPSLSGGGAPTSYSVSPALPAGLSLNTTTGAITGTPTTTAGVATATYTVTATNSCGSTTKGVSITISPAAPSGLTYGTDPATYCANVAISTNSPSLSGGGAPTSYSVSPALPAGLSLNTTTGAITGTPTTTAGVATATYTVTATNSCGSTTKGVSITISPAAPSGLTYGTDPATYCANVAISTNSPSLSGGGAPTSYSVSPALPAGLSLNTTTGAITGTPTTTAGVATATYTVTATNSCGSTTKGVSITISPAAPSGLTYGTDPATYCANVAISTNSPSLSGGGAPTSYSVSPALPAGLSLNTTTGAITGTPTTTAGVATATYTVTATNSCGSTTKGVSITISPAAPSGLTYGTDPATYCANVAISTNSPSLSGGGAPTSYSVSPALPAGLSLNTTTGAITGTPTTTAGVATATYTVTATNSCGSTTKGVSITIDGSPTTALAGPDQSNCNNTSFTLAGNTPTVGTGSWSLISGTATIAAPSANNSGVTGVPGGTSATLRWTISSGICTASTDDVVLSNATNPSTPTSGGDKEACYRATVPDLTVTVGAGETADWYDAASGGTLVKGGSLTFNEATDGSGLNPTAGTYTYYVEGRNTTSGCLSSARIAVTLTIRAVPVISPTATPGIACGGDNVLLDANATAGAGTITSYAWSSGLGAVASGTVNPTTTTTYTVTVQNSYSCTNDASTTVTVKSAAALVVLPASTVTTLVEQCTDGGWTYYANASSPDDWTFAIRKNGNTFTAQVDISVAAGTIDHLNTSKAGYEHGSYLMKRYWDVNVTSGSISTSVDVKFFYDPAEKTAAENARDAAWSPYSATASKTSFRWFKTVGVPFGSSQISAIDGNSFNAFSNITLTESASGTENGVTYAQFNGITSFSGGTGGYGFSSPGTGLPVKLIDFTATAIENSYIRLDWSTALELNNAGFEVERSTNGTEFTKIAWVQGHDNSTVRQDYVYDDKTAQPNIRYYYRLKQIDNGNVAFEYSNIVTATIISEGKTAVGDFVPNPAKDKATIDLFIGKDQTVVIDVYEVTGKFIKSEKLDMKKGFNTYFIQTDDMSAATYLVSFKMDDQRISKRLNVLK